MNIVVGQHDHVEKARPTTTQLCNHFVTATHKSSAKIYSTLCSIRNELRLAEIGPAKIVQDSVLGRGTTDLLREASPSNARSR
jgi:hypothetical protein